MTLSAALLEHWVFGSFLCKLVNFTPTLTALVSTFTVAVIAVERWFFIVNRQKFHRHCTILTLILLWIVSIFIALPEFVSRELQESVSPVMFSYMLQNYSLLPLKPSTDTNIPMSYYTVPQPCPMKKIYYCVLEPGLHMRVFSYFVIIVQYLVPLLFVSISCYSISRFLKKRMKRMCAYELHNKTTSFNQKMKNTSAASTHEFLDPDLMSSAETPDTIVSIDAKPTYLSSPPNRLSQPRDKCQDRPSLPIKDPQQYLINQSHSRRRFHRSRKLLICIAALFTISWLPLTIVQLYLENNEEVLYTRDGANFVYGFLLIPSYLISSLSSWFNPVIYNYINRSFRREFYALYSCIFTARSPPTSRKDSTTFVPKNYRREASPFEESNASTTYYMPTKQGNFATGFMDERTLILSKDH